MDYVVAFVLSDSSSMSLPEARLFRINGQFPFMPCSIRQGRISSYKFHLVFPFSYSKLRSRCLLLGGSKEGDENRVIG